MNKLFKFQETNINILGTNDTPMFFGSQIAKALGYMNTRDAIINHVWKENKTPVKEYRLISKGSDSRLSDDLHPQTILINEFGMYQLIMSSKLQTAKIFQQWLLSDVLPTIRKTGAYQMPQLQNNQFMILNEYDLNNKVVAYLRRYYGDILFNASLGDNQDTDEKRINSWKLGYTSGFPDLVIYEHNQLYNGLSIEFKSPNGKGKLSVKQREIIKRW